jgi:heme/copper-type cytochrome/quinol oxidase subunit 1
VHPLKHPRNAVIVGITFILVGVLYYLWPTITGGYFEPSGLALLVLLGVAMSIMAYVLVAGSPRD